MPATLATRTQLRDALVAALTVAVPTVGSRIHPGRAWPQPGAGQTAAPVFPALLVYTDAWLRQSLANGVLTAKCQFRIHARSERKFEADAEAELDAMALGIEAVVFADATLLALVLDVEELVTERKLDAQGQRVVGEDVHTVTFKMAGFL